MSREGLFYIVAAPSGAGKTSLVKSLAESMNAIKISISYTTRAARPGEIEGSDYHFVTDTEFDHMIKTKQFLEHAEVYGYKYGTSHQWVLRQLAKGVDVLLEIDWQGARQVCQLFPHAVSIFVLPPSIEVLRERLMRRGQDDANIIESRMAAARAEISHCHEFDYVVVNDDFEVALHDLRHIVKSQRLLYTSQAKNLVALLAELSENQ